MLARGEPRNELLLIVEDECSLREMLSKWLTRHGYRVVVAGSGQEALAILDRLESVPALLITDVLMPGMDGHALVLKVRERLSELPVIYISGFADHAVLDTGALRDIDRFLQKPFAPAALAQMVRDLLDAHAS